MTCPNADSPPHSRGGRLGLHAPGWWVDVEHPDSIAAISSAIGEKLRDGPGLERVTVSTLQGDNRTATTVIDTRLCRADTGLTGDPMTADGGTVLEPALPACR